MAKKKQKTLTISEKDLDTFRDVVSHYMEVSYEGDDDEGSCPMDELMRKIDTRLNND